MKEREYSFKAKSSLVECQDFCISNGFELVSATEQYRTIFRKGDKTIARITEDKKDDGVRFSLDFKEDKMSDDALVIRKESRALEFEDVNAVMSILDFLEYKKDNVLHRKRWVYTKGDVVCEIDHYDDEEGSIVVSLEGEDYSSVDAFFVGFLESCGK